MKQLIRVTQVSECAVIINQNITEYKLKLVPNRLDFTSSTIFRAKRKKGRAFKSKNGPKTEVSAFSCHLLIDLCHFLRVGVSRDAERNGEVQNGFTSCFACQTGSASIILPVIDFFLSRFLSKGVSTDDGHNGEVENVVTSCFGR